MVDYLLSDKETMANLVINKLGTGPEIKMGCTVKLIWRMRDIEQGVVILASGFNGTVDYQMQGDLVWRRHLLGQREGSHVRFDLDEKGDIGDKYSMSVVIKLVTQPLETYNST